MVTTANISFAVDVYYSGSDAPIMDKEVPIKLMETNAQELYDAIKHSYPYMYESIINAVKNLPEQEFARRLTVYDTQWTVDRENTEFWKKKQSDNRNTRLAFGAVYRVPCVFNVSGVLSAYSEFENKNLENKGDAIHISGKSEKQDTCIIRMSNGDCYVLPIEYLLMKVLKEDIRIENFQKLLGWKCFVNESVIRNIRKASPEDYKDVPIKLAKGQKAADTYKNEGKRVIDDYQRRLRREFPKTSNLYMTGTLRWDPSCPADYTSRELTEDELKKWSKESGQSVIRCILYSDPSFEHVSCYTFVCRGDLPDEVLKHHDRKLFHDRIVQFVAEQYKAVCERFYCEGELIFEKE